MIRAGLLLLLLLLSASPGMSQTPNSTFTAAEQALILSLGPWPPPPVPDSSNRVSGKPAGIRLGQALFFDANLSLDGKQSCASCHQPGAAWSRPDRGAGGLGRNIPTLLDVRWNRWFGWDGGQDSLWAQSLRPLLDPAEMHSSLAGIADTLRQRPDYACAYQAAFGAPMPQDDERLAIDAAKALAAFQETLVSAQTPFDRFRAALEQGDLAAQQEYPETARRGLKLFIGRGNCVLCHFGPAFTNREFHDIGVPYFVRPGLVDPGRFGGITRLRESRYTLLGPFSDDPARSSAATTRHVDRQPRNWGEFRVPSLRSLVATAPYMHNGHLATLRDVVRFYSELNEERLHADGERLLRPLHLTDGESGDLVAFLQSLSADSPQTLSQQPLCR